MVMEVLEQEQVVHDILEHLREEEGKKEIECRKEAFIRGYGDRCGHSAICRGRGDASRPHCRIVGDKASRQIPDCDKICTNACAHEWNVIASWHEK